MAQPGSNIVSIFQEEASERLERAVELLLRLEQDADDRDSLNALFREAHTLKGSAATAGFDDFATVAHAMEEQLQPVRNDERTFTADLCDALLAAVDDFRTLLEAWGTEEPPKVDPAAILERLASAGAARPGGKPKQAKSRDRKDARTGNTSGARPAKIGAKQSKPELKQAKPSGKARSPKAKQPRAPRKEKLVEPRPTRTRSKPSGRDEGPSKGDQGASSTGGSLPETVRTHVEDLDQVLALVGEKSILEGRTEPEVQHAADLARRLAVLKRRVLGLPEEQAVELDEIASNMESLERNLHSQLDAGNVILDELHSRALKMRMVPLSTISSRYPRLVRDLARSSGKDVKLTVSGADTELDRTLLEKIAEPLTHLLRNAVDHGIEAPEERRKAGKPAQGSITFKAYQEADRVIIEVADDGRGIDVERLGQTSMARELSMSADDLRDPSALLAFLARPGVTESTNVTEVSGRGVGLDAVASAIKQANGHMSLETEPGKGSCFRLTLPLTVARVRGLVLRAGDHRFLLPSGSVDTVVRLSMDDIDWVAGQAVTAVAGKEVPTVELSHILGLAKGQTTHWERQRPAVVIKAEGRQLCLLCDGVLETREAVIKSLGSFLGNAPLCSGCTILDDARIAPILDPAQIVAVTTAAATAGVKPAAPAEKHGPRVLVVEDSFTVRELQRGILESVGYEVATANDGLDALEKVKGGAFDLVVTDIDMPRMDGFDFTKAVREELSLPSLPIVVVSAKESEEDRRRGLEAGADAYVEKSSYDQKALLDIVERLLAT